MLNGRRYKDVSGRIFMSEEVYNDLIDNQLDYDMSYVSIRDDMVKFGFAPAKLMLKDYFSEIKYIDGYMKIESYARHSDLRPVFKSVVSKLDEDDVGYVEALDEDDENRFCFWLAKNEVMFGKWEEQVLDFKFV